MAKISKKAFDYPSVLALEKKIVLSDGYFFGVNWIDRYSKQVALHNTTQTVRGIVETRSLSEKGKLTSANLQSIDRCYLPIHIDTLHVKFSIKFMGRLDELSACNSPDFESRHKLAVKDYISKYGFTELARRYALNIANARFLWRNRVGAENIEVIVHDNDGTKWVFNSYDYSLFNFDVNNDEQINRLANKIASALSSNIPYFFVTVDCYAKLGIGQEVFPSEELILNSSAKAKVLYTVDNQSAFHSQKIGNAIRTIDTWYRAKLDQDDIVKPISIEVFGTNTFRNTVKRPPKKGDFYTLYDKLIIEEKLDHPEDEHYVMAMLIRGGVFGKSGKD